MDKQAIGGSQGIGRAKGIWTDLGEADNCWSGGEGLAEQIAPGKGSVRKGGHFQWRIRHRKSNYLYSNQPFINNQPFHSSIPDHSSVHSHPLIPTQSNSMTKFAIYFRHFARRLTRITSPFCAYKQSQNGCPNRRTFCHWAGRKASGNGAGSHYDGRSEREWGPETMHDSNLMMGQKWARENGRVLGWGLRQVAHSGN